MNINSNIITPTLQIKSERGESWDKEIRYKSQYDGHYTMLDSDIYVSGGGSGSGLGGLDDGNNNHSSEIINPDADPDGEKLLKEYVCKTYGLSLSDYMSHIHGGSESEIEDVHVNASLYQNGSDSSYTDLTSLGIDLDSLDSLSAGVNSRIHENGSVCSSSWDGILCWPETLVGDTANLACFREFNTVIYDTSDNATRFCDVGLDGGGIWNTTNYDGCKPIGHNTSINDNESNILALTTGVYFCGYCLSLAAVTIAMIIFLAFKELRCLRNTIHTHLIITYILADTLWIITSSTTFTSSAPLDAQVQVQVQPGSGQSQVSCVTYILLHYFHLTNFFWMFVEGLYLYVLVVQTFVAENIKLRVYVSIGWGLPMAVVIGWAIAKWLNHSSTVGSQGSEAELDESCIWLAESNYDWIYKAPVIFTLASNSLFLLQIMWVLITKLRSATNPETQQSMKAAKALVVLMPLLGITYLLMLAGSREPAYEFTRALLISTQGFLVALLYCFLNGEVRKALRHRWNRFRTMGPGPNCCDFGRRSQMQQMRDWSPRSRTESIRLYTPATHAFRKRESSASEATTMTTLHGSMNSNGVGGIGHRLSTTYLPVSQKFYNNSNTNVESNNTFI